MSDLKYKILKLIYNSEDRTIDDTTFSIPKSTNPIKSLRNLTNCAIHLTVVSSTFLVPINAHLPTKAFMPLNQKRKCDTKYPMIKKKMPSTKRYP